MTILAALHALSYSAVALLLLTGVGNWACQVMLSLTGLKDATAVSQSGQSGNLRAGRIIGALERILIAIGLLAHSWEVLVAIIAIKTTARFKELDEKLSAEYFLVGSLFSIIWAFIVTTLWVGYDHGFGLDLRGHVQILLGMTAPK